MNHNGPLPCICCFDLKSTERERDELRAFVDVADGFWSVVESICDQARRTWEHEDTRMKWVTVQINKVDLEVLNAAYRPAAEEDT